jgi:hypothetical protein
MVHYRALFLDLIEMKDLETRDDRATPPAEQSSRSREAQVTRRAS